MATITELVATISGRIDGFRKAMADGANATDKFAGAWTKAGADIATAASRIGGAVGVMAGGLVAYSARLGIAFNQMKEDAVTEFTVLLQSADKAKAMLEEIQQFAAKTPLETTDLTRAAQLMLNFGVAGESIMPLLQRLGDAASGDAQKFQQLALAYSQCSSAGRLMGGDLLQMVAAGFNPLNIISQQTGESMLSLRKRMEEGRISLYDVNQALISVTSSGGMFYGMMDAKSRTFTGLMSSMVDAVKMAAGKMFEPLSDGLKKTLERMTAANDAGAFNSWVGTMQYQVARVTNELMALGEANAGDILRAIGDAFVWAGKGAAECVRWVRMNSPEIGRAAREWSAFLQPVGKWIADNPRLVASLIATAAAFKALQFLGVISAFTSLIGIIGPTIQLLSKLPVAFAAVRTAAFAAQASMATFLLTNPIGIGITAGLLIVANMFAKVAREARAANQQAEIWNRRLDDRDKKERNKILDFEGASDQDTLTYLKEQRNLAEKNRVGLESQATSAARQADKAGWMEGMFGSSANDAAVANRRAQEAGDFVADLDRKIKELSEKGGKTYGESASSAMGPTASNASAEEDAKKAEKKRQKDIDKSLAQHRNDALEQKYDGYDKIRDFVGLKPSTEQVQDFAGSQKGVDKALAAEFAKLYEESDKSVESLDQLALALARTVAEEKETEKRTNTVGDKMEDFREKLNDLKGVVPAKELQGFAAQFDRLGQAFVDGKLTSDQYRDGLKNLNRRVDDSKQASGGTRDIDDAISQSRKKLLDLSGQGTVGGDSKTNMISDALKVKTFAKFDEFESQAAKLGESLKSGTISSGQYSIELAKLKKATDDVTEAALKEEQRKRREALLKGDFAGAGLDFNKSVQDKLADRQMSQFEQYVQQFVDAMYPLAPMVQQVTDGFSSLYDNVEKYGTAIAQGVTGNTNIGGQADPAAVAWFNSWASSIQGQIVQFQNAIQMHVQALTFLNDPQRIQQEIAAINALTDQIKRLNNSVATFNGQRSYDPIFRDPGISGAAAAQVLHNTVNISVPNMVSATQGEIDYLATAVAQSLARQGGKIFS